MNDSLLDLQRIRGVANYQFGEDVGKEMFPSNVKIVHSRRTGRIRHLYIDSVLVATLRPHDGLFSLTLAGAKRLKNILKHPRIRVIIHKDVEEYIMEGRDVFSRHVVRVDQDIRPGEEVVVTNEQDDVLAVGKALLSGTEILHFKRGKAVKVRSAVGRTIS